MRSQVGVGKCQETMKAELLSTVSGMVTATATGALRPRSIECSRSPKKQILISKHAILLLAVSVLITVCGPAPGQPVLSTQPSDAFLSASSGATFSVSVSGTAPFSYRWLFDGTAIPGATNGSLSLAHPSPAQWGYYSVIVSNAFGSVTSRVAELKVFVPVQHNLSGIQSGADGSLSLSLSGETSAPFAPYYDLYPLETSTNLIDWVPLATVQRANAALTTLRFVDVDAPRYPQRYYRTPTNQLATPVPQPTGPYAVGTFSMLLTNTSRSNAQFMTTFWYPSTAQVRVLPNKYVEQQLAFSSSGYYNVNGNFGSRVAEFFSHSLSNAPFATNLAPCPVVLYDPGALGHRRENTEKAEDLASWGYVVVGLDGPDTYLSVFPDGRVVGTHAVGSGTQQDLVEARLLDLQFVLDELQVLNAGDPRLGKHLDLDRIGAFGWSLGGGSVAQLCLRDPRCKAGAGLDAFFIETNFWAQALRVPYLFVRGDWGQDDPFDDRLAGFNHLVTNAYWLRLVSTVHGSFCDADLILDSPSIASIWTTPISGQFLPPARLSQVLRSYLLSFFNKFLKQNDNHLLDGPAPAYPEVLQFLSTSDTSGSPKCPSGALVQGSDTNFYGTTAYGGTNGNNGTVFQVTPAGTLRMLTAFNGTNGSHPVAGLVQGNDGNFYGTTTYGGTNGDHGTVFQVTPAGALRTLVAFDGANGGNPVAGLVQGSDGNFYGTTIRGGAHDLGTVFKVTPEGALTMLVSFNATNGGVPCAALVEGTNGNFYGTTKFGGNLSLDGGSGFGTVFQMTPDGVLTTLVAFSGDTGAIPLGGLVQDSGGNFYGTTAFGGDLSLNAGYGFGTVFRMTPAGARTTLVTFTGANGGFCVSGLIQGADGNFYGTTAGGGAGGGGTIFKMSPTGVLTTLVAFDSSNGSRPQAALVRGRDGSLYGTTEYSGPGRGGTVFQLTLAGVLRTLVAFGN